MKIAVLGSTGMLGHVVYEYFSGLKGFDVVGFCRCPRPDKNEIKFDLQVQTVKQSLKLIESEEPDVVINCIGLLIKESQDFPERAAFINSMFPKLLENNFNFTTTRVIQISTDCIFKGGYFSDLYEERYDTLDVHDETSVYGVTKSLGEICNMKDLTIRTSIIGPELYESGVGLLNWFWKQSKVKGYSNFIWNGVTTLQLAKFIEISINSYYTGIVQYGCAVPVSKFALLHLVKFIFKNEVEIEKDSSSTNVKTLKMKEYIRRDSVKIVQQLYELRDFMLNYDLPNYLQAKKNCAKIDRNV